MVEKHEVSLSPRGATALIEIHHDEDYQADDEEFFLVRTYESGASMEAAGRKQGLTLSMMRCLSNGGMLLHEGKLYAGLERYRHSGDAYARCGHGNFPDRQWDVVPFCGWIMLDQQMDGDVLPPEGEELPADQTQILERIDSRLDYYNEVISGNVWGYVVKIVNRHHDIDLGIEDSCWGFVGDSDGYVLEEAKRVAEHEHLYLMNQKEMFGAFVDSRMAGDFGAEIWSLALSTLLAADPSLTVERLRTLKNQVLADTVFSVLMERDHYLSAKALEYKYGLDHHPKVFVEDWLGEIERDYRGSYWEFVRETLQHEKGGVNGKNP